MRLLSLFPHEDVRDYTCKAKYQKKKMMYGTFYGHNMRKVCFHLTLMFLSLLAQLLMMESDCWKRVPPMPMTSAIS